MRLFKIFLISLSFGLYFMAGGLLSLILYPYPPWRWSTMNRLSHALICWLCTLLGIKVTVCGYREFLQDRGYLLISRHIGYIDGLILGSLSPLTFVSKSEVKAWPVIGKAVHLAGTIFINRQNKNCVSQSLNEIAGRLQSGINVLIFPEGTSSNGEKVLPFQTSLFDAPITAGASIIPVTITYTSIDGNEIQSREDIAWYGGMPFSQHLWNLLRFKKIEAVLTVHQAISAKPLGKDVLGRKKLAQLCHQRFLDLEYQTESREYRPFRRPHQTIKA